VEQGRGGLLKYMESSNSQEFSHSLGSLKLGFLVLAVVIKQ